MHRIDGPGATVDGKFTEGDPVGGIQATVVTDDWLNEMQEEVISVLTAASLTPAKGTQNQLAQAIAKIIQGQLGSTVTTAGTAAAYTLAPSPAIDAYTAGQRFHVKFHVLGAATPTINVSGKGAKSIKQYDSSGAKVAAVIGLAQVSDIVYDGTDFILLDQLPTSTVQRKQNFRGLSKNLKVSASGVSASISVTADNVIVANAAGDAQAIASVSLTLNTAAVASATVDGMASGVTAINTWYAVYAWYNSTSGVTRITGDSSFTAPTAPAAGFDMWALISVFRTDGTGSKFPLGFTQTGVKWRYTVKTGTNVATSIVLATGTTSGATSPLLLTAVAPPGITVISVGLTAQNASSGGVAANNQYAAFPSLTNPQPLSAGANATTFSTTFMGDIVIETPNTIWWGANSSAVTVTINGFEVLQ